MDPSSSSGAYVIFNPRAGRGRTLSEIEQALGAAGISAVVASSTAPADVSALAQAAVQAGHSLIVAAGGDGTVNQVVSGMLSAGATAPLAILPVGTGNDLAFHLKVPKRLEDAARVIAAGHTRALDVIYANEKPFVNCSGLAIEAHISHIQAQLPRRWGNLRYLVATLLGVRKPPTWRVQLEWGESSYNGLVTLLSVGNCPRTGGMFYTVPHANPYDGLLSFTFVHLKKRRQIIAALPMTLRSDRGAITEHPLVREVHSRWLRVRSDPPLPVHVDGELFAQPVSAIEYRVRPGAIQVVSASATPS